MVDYKLSLVGLSVLIVLHTVDYRLSLVWGLLRLAPLLYMNVIVSVLEVDNKSGNKMSICNCANVCMLMF